MRYDLKMHTSFFAVSMLVGLVCAQYGEMLSPRFYAGGLVGRADECPLANSHTCNDVNSTACCSNTEFCIIDTSFSAACCQIGSNCGNPCPTTAYICPTTITISGTPTLSRACCNRSCPSVSAYKCAASLGGGCCSYGSVCQSGTGGRSCVATQTSSSQAVASVIPSGCTTNQYACASGLGGGCCDNGMVCTVSANTNYCAFATGTNVLVRTGTGGIVATAISQDSGKKALSTGAKAGIGVGVSLGALLIIGIGLYFCVVHRRHAASVTRSQQMEQSQPANSRSGGSALGGGGSEANGSRVGGSNRPPVVRNASQPSDYFGPDATPGPFTEGHTRSAGTSPGYDRGVPTHPQSPGDIASPVEIDSRDHSNVQTPRPIDHRTINQSSLPNTVEHRIELP